MTSPVDLHRLFYASWSLIPIILFGILGFQKLNIFFKLFFFQAIVCLIVYTINHVTALEKHSHTIFNIYLPVEFILITLAGIFYFNDKSNNLLGIVSLGIYSILYASEIFIEGQKQLVNITMIVGAVLLVILYLKIIKTASEKLYVKMPAELFVSMGIVLYFSGSIPLIGLLFYLFKYFPDQTKNMFSEVVEPLGHIRYLLTALSMVLFLRPNGYDLNNKKIVS